MNAFIAFIAFCFSASAIYILNDYHDIDEDRKHPKKKDRPLASGAISKHYALMLMALFLVTGSSIMYTLSHQALGLLFAYILINIAYTMYLKHICIIDVIIIAIGFVIRIILGANVTLITPSMWIIVMTFLLAVFIALAKRRNDVLLYLSTGKKTRKVIDGYNLQFLDIAMTIMASTVIVAYILYTISPEVAQKLNFDYAYLTSLFVIIGIMRYLQITLVEHKSGAPTMLLFKDTFIQLTLLGWLSSFAWILYL